MHVNRVARHFQERAPQPIGRSSSSVHIYAVHLRDFHFIKKKEKGGQPGGLHATRPFGRASPPASTSLGHREAKRSE
jgi:hypothetical protein